MEESQNNYELNVARYIVEKTRNNLLLTGSAGTGKTSFLKDIVKHSRKKLVVLAPTGLAAVNAGGMTIHSFFRFPLGPYLPQLKTEEPFYSLTKSRKALIKALELIIIDEVSMVRVDLLDRMDSALRRIRENNDPFGGVQLLLIGDLRQLPPVVHRDEQRIIEQFYPSCYFFDSKALNKVEYYCVELETVYRQQNDRRFIELLKRARENKVSPSDTRLLNTRYFPRFRNDGQSIRIVTHKRQVEEINSSEMDKLQGTPYFFDATITGNFPKDLPADKRLTIKEGARVMFIRNDPGKQFVNGTLGKVTYVDKNNISVKIDNGEEICLERMKWEYVSYSINENKSKVETITEGSFVQYPIVLAWAITVHKSQGLTFDKAIIDVHAAFSPGQAYVALSRCRSLDGITLSARLFSSVFKKDEVVDEFLSRNHIDIRHLAETVNYDYFEYGGNDEMPVPSHSLKKTASEQESFRLFSEGLTVAEIAERRSLTENTIHMHLVKYVERGEIDIFSLIDNETFESVSRYQNDHPDNTSLRSLYEYFGGRVSYTDIKYALAYIRWINANR